jgi:hypothetical protein
MHWLWKETYNRLERFDRLVQEGRGMDEALGFVRYLKGSGLLKLFNVTFQESPLKVDGPLIHWRCNELEQSILRRYSTGDLQGRIEPKDLQTLHEKLDTLAGYVSKLVPAIAPRPFAVEHESLTVIPGGLAGDHDSQICEAAKSDTVAGPADGASPLAQDAKVVAADDSRVSCA